MTATEPEPPAVQTWPSIPVEDLELTEYLNELLAGKGIVTVGVLLDALARGEFDGLLEQADHDALREAVNLAAADDPEYEPLPLLRDLAEARRLEEYDIETAAVVAAEEAKVSELEAEWESAHATASVRKKRFEAARDEMRSLIRKRMAERHTPPKKPDPTLFDHVTDEPTGAVPAELWREYPLDRFTRWGLTDKDVEKLAAGETKSHGTHPLVQLGDVTRFITPLDSNPAYARSLKDIKGFGDAALERWSNAETAFWKWWKEGGDAEFAREKGVLTDADATPAGPGGEGAGDGQAGADGPAAETPTPEPFEQPPEKLRANPKTGELEPIGEKPKRRKGKG